MPRRKRLHTSPTHWLEPLQHHQETAVGPPPGLVSGPVQPLKDSARSSKQAANDKNADRKTSLDDGPTPTGKTPASEVKSGLSQPETSIAQTTTATTSPSPRSNSSSVPSSTDSGSKTKTPETVLHMNQPSSSSDSATEKHPSLHAPRYVHHFDTYTLVRDLQKKGFTEEQSITLMKAVRGLLAVNLDLAGEGLVSKKDVENATYLFRAACSELSTEIHRNRQAETERMRTERAQLQHEVDILSQRLNQELLTLKDDLKGMFNDRKLAVRMEQRAMESSIQELNYKITVLLNSDAKSEVEGLRWVLTRRAAIAIASMAVLILGSLRYNSYQAHQQEQARRKATPSSIPPDSSTPSVSTAALVSGIEAHSSSLGSGVGSVGAPALSALAKEGQATRPLENLPQGQDPSYVSLG